MLQMSLKKKSLDSNDASDDVFKQRLVCGFYLDVEKVSVFQFND